MSKAKEFYDTTPANRPECKSCFANVDKYCQVLDKNNFGDRTCPFKKKRPRKKKEAKKEAK